MIIQKIRTAGRRSAAATSKYIDGLTHAAQKNERVQFSFGNVSDAEEFEAIAFEFAKNHQCAQPVFHFVFSPEATDRPLTLTDFQKMIDTFFEERGAPTDTMYKAAVHLDGHDSRHPQHMHLLVGRFTPSGQKFSDSNDYKVCRSAAARIENKMGLTQNSGRAGAKKAPALDPALIEDLARRSRNLQHFRKQLYSRGIKTSLRTHARTGEIYGIKFALATEKSWTAGGDISESCRLKNLTKLFGEHPAPGATRQRADALTSQMRALLQQEEESKSREEIQREHDRRQGKQIFSKLLNLFKNNPLPKATTAAHPYRTNQQQQQQAQKTREAMR